MEPSGGATMGEPNEAPPAEGEDAAASDIDILFANGTPTTRPPVGGEEAPSLKTKANGGEHTVANVAKGKYSSVKPGSPPKQHRTATVMDVRRTPLQAGISKLMEASLRYHPDKDGALKQGFAGEGLTPLELKEMLRRLFHIKLTEPELSAVFAHFVPDGGMELDGNVFMIQFIQIGQAERDRRRIAHVEIERQRTAQKARDTANLSRPPDPAEALNHLATDAAWGPEDKASAMAMITEAAVTYDKSSPAAVSLDAFEGATMTPLVFREQIRRVFNIKLSPQQLAALMSVFDKDKDGTVNCAEFLLQFCLQGSQERSRRLEARRDGERKRREREAAELEARRAEAEERARMKVDYNYTGDEQAQGLAKLVEAATVYDATGPACLGLGAFQGDNMTPHMFREQLRKVFNIKLTPTELGAVMNRFDKDEDGTVDVVEFTKMFFKMGFEERTKRTKERRDAEAQREALLREEERRRHLEKQRQNALKVSSSFSEEHHASAMAKITKAAARYDKTHPSAVNLDAFDGAEMEPHVFREQLKRAFAIKLTPPELGATIHTFDKDGDGLVSCPEFLRTFFRLGFDAKNAASARRRKRDREMAGKAREEAAEKEREIACLAALNVSDNFDDEDKASAMSKIAEAASRYDKNHPSCLGLNGFEGALMPPHVFKEQLKKVFGLKLSPGELGATMKEFDKDGDGTVNCAEFLLTFFRVGFDTRNKALHRRREEEAARLKRTQREENRRYVEMERKKGQAASPYTEKDLDETLDILIETGARYDRRQLGPAGLKAWEVKSMSPAELKGALQRTFDIRLSSPQLGAMAHLFGTGTGTAETESYEGVFAPPVQIEVPEFLTTFFKISAAAKGMAAKSDSAVKLKEYRLALKERLLQQEEIRRTLKAMRDNPPKRPHTVDSGLSRVATRGGKRGLGARTGASTDSGEKIRFQVTAARSTKRLDLSTWANRKQGDFLLSRVPRTVWQLSGLKELWLTNNDIQALPPQIKELKQLRTLGVGRNRISRLPGELGLLPHLEQVFAEKNWLSALPRELAMCRSLRELRLGGNQITRLPGCVPELRALEVLDLRGNTIENLPDDLKFMRSLLDLDLEGNPIGPEVPKVLFTLVNLARLNLAGTMLGPEQGARLEAALRLDSLCVNDNAPPPPAIPASQQRGEQTDPRRSLGSISARHDNRAVFVPEQRLREVQDQIPGYSTKRLPGLDVLPSDARAMMRAKAKKSKSTTSFGVDAGDRPRTSGGIVKRGGFAASCEGYSGRLGTASAIVAATGVSAMRL